MNRIDKRSNRRAALLVLAGFSAWACGDKASDASGSAPAATSSEAPAAAQQTPAAAVSGAAGKSTAAPAAAAANGVAGKPASAGGAVATTSTAAAGSGGAGTLASSAKAGTAAPSEASAGAPATAAAGAGAAEPGASHPDLGKGDGSDVITIGDSWMAGIAPALRTVSGQMYRDYSVGGAPLLQETAGSGGRKTIVQQYETALMANPMIKTVVATAGGIDTLEGPGQGADGNMKLLAELNKLFEKMAADGVEDIVYYAYSRSQGASIEMLWKTQMTACDASPVRCHLIDSDTIIMGMLGDGIHPTQKGSMDLAAAAFKMMTDEGMRR